MKPNTKMLKCYIPVGTHDIISLTVNETQSNEVKVTTVYSEYSDASGALFNFVCIEGNATKYLGPALLALDRNISQDYTLPLNLFAGQCRLFVYDIEYDGTLSLGVGYPAVTDGLITGKDGHVI